MSAINRSGIHMVSELILSLHLAGRNGGDQQYAASAIRVKAEHEFQLHAFIVDGHLCRNPDSWSTSSSLVTYRNFRAR